MSELAAAPERLLQINSLRRAGQHMLVEVLGGCLDATGIPWAHVNDVDNNLQPGHPQYVEWTAEAVFAKGGGVHTIITNYEDYPFGDRHNSRVYAELAGTRVPSTDVVLLRDFATLAASRMIRLAKAKREGDPTVVPLFSLEHARDIWVEQAELALRPSTDGTIVALYNRIVARDAEGAGYREKLAADLGLMSSDAGLDRVPHFGGGSSVDGQKFDGRPQDMQVLARWHNLEVAQHEELLKVIGDPTIDRLNNRLFGFGAAEVAAQLATKAETH